jgi:uncharacterized protein with beta-barrel porin domain
LHAGSHPTGFTVKGPDAGDDRLQLGLGASFDVIADVSIRAAYEGRFSSDEQSHGTSLGLAWKF